MDNLRERIEKAICEQVDIVPYDPHWGELFAEEKRRLLSWLPADLVGRVEHFGSTAVPGLQAKPIVDILVEVTDLRRVREEVVPLLTSRGYDYFWRPTFGDDQPPWYAWFIRRDAAGQRTHHIHMVERDFDEHWDRLLFRDYLIENPAVALKYGALKQKLADDHPHDRVKYTAGKTEFILQVMERAKNQAEG